MHRRAPANQWIAFDDVEFVRQPNLLANSGFEQDAPNQSGWQVFNDGSQGSATYAQTGGVSTTFRQPTAGSRTGCTTRPTPGATTPTPSKR